MGKYAKKEQRKFHILSPVSNYSEVEEITVRSVLLCHLIQVSKNGLVRPESEILPVFHYFFCRTVVR